MTSKKPKRSIAIIWSISAALITVSCLGCSRGPKIASVRGTVTLDGEPLPYAAVVFNPANGRPAGATTDENGEYALNFTQGREGALIGEHRVIITTRRDPWKDPNGEVHPSSSEKLPTKYNTQSTLTFTVEPGKTNVADFDLESSAPESQASRKPGARR
ncbi:carboxypeptidase-like regulatory domain-containing protein [Schlesneria sp. T3-172]|uniref:carboxypeptidase-like regulatory domain-containing protein n=1 Tax=Schlesneria sphaerica TaxID=3373610 RepID=UPI0037C5D6D7